MDILDTFGDWVQLTVTIAVVFFLLQYYLLIARAIVSHGISTTVLGILLWVSVYDYDIALGLLIGGIIHVMMGLSFIRSYSDDDFIQEEVMPRFMAGLMITIIMITKIVLFW